MSDFDLAQTFGRPFGDAWADMHQRLGQAYATVNTRSITILRGHLCAELQLEAALAHLLPRASKLRKLSFGHKVSVLLASVASEALDNYARAFLTLNDLRNAVAHGDPDVEVRTLFNRFYEEAQLPWHDEGFQPTEEEWEVGLLTRPLTSILAMLQAVQELDEEQWGTIRTKLAERRAELALKRNSEVL